MTSKPAGTLLLCGILAATAAAPRPARAEEPPPPRAPLDRGPSDPSYSGEVVLADLAALGLLATPLPYVSGAGVVSWLFTPAVIHLVHDRPGRAAGSVGLRLALPVAGAFAGRALVGCDDSGDDSLCGLEGSAIGGLLGVVAASIVDAAVLAGGSPDQPTPPRPLIELAGVTVDHAGLAPNPNGAGFVLGGRF